MLGNTVVRRRIVPLSIVILVFRPATDCKLQIEQEDAIPGIVSIILFSKSGKYFNKSLKKLVSGESI